MKPKKIISPAKIHRKQMELYQIHSHLIYIEDDIQWIFQMKQTQKKGHMTAGKDGVQLKWKWTPSAAHNIQCIKKKNAKMHTGNIIFNIHSVNVCETNDCFMLFFLNARLTRNVILICSLKGEILRFLAHATHIQ